MDMETEKVSGIENRCPKMDAFARLSIIGDCLLMFLSIQAGPRRENTRLGQFGWLLGLLAAISSPCFVAHAQPTTPQQLVQQVIDNELVATQNDHSLWMYRDAYRSPNKNLVKLVVETSQGTISRTIQMDGHPLTQQQQQLDQSKMQSVVNDPAVRARQRKNSAHDDQQSVSLMKILPRAFLWTQTGESNGEIALHFQPNPAYQPPTYASRVFAAMAGRMVVDAKQKRLKVLSGKLIHPVEFGWGLFGKLEQGGTFHVVRSEIAPGIWQITQTHVHIEGRALIFKSIGEQEDEVSSNYKPTPPSLTLEQAYHRLINGAIARDLGLNQEGVAQKQ